MRVAVTGPNGQLARCLNEAGAGRPDLELLFLGRPGFDLLDRDSVLRAVESARPDIVVSAAAFTAVDRAESEPALAFAVNADGAGHVAEGAARAGAALIHISTDYVFSGRKGAPYTEADRPSPLNVYGRSKLKGEERVAALGPRYAILRTSWVFSPFGANFVKTVLRLARERDAVCVVADQHGNPTSAHDFAEAVLLVAKRLHADGQAPTGVFHATGGGSASWFELAQHVMEQSRLLGGPFIPVQAIESAGFPTAAERPSDSRLSCAKFEMAFSWRAPPWTDSCRAVVKQLLRQVPS